MNYKTVYEYAVLPLSVVVSMCATHEPLPDSYISDDQESRSYAALLAKGFRWIRTDGDMAIFERSRIVWPKMKD